MKGIGKPDLIKKEVDGKDDQLEGWTRIDEKAKSLGETFKEKLQKAKEYAREMEAWRTEAIRWSAPDGYGWPDVRSVLLSAAEGTNAYFKATLEKVDVACKQLSWGTQHPEVKKAAGELKEHASARDSDYVKLRDRALAFVIRVRKYRALLAEDDAKIHELVCVTGSERGDEDMEEAVAEIANRWASQLASDWHILEPEAEQIKRDADVLIARKVPNARKVKRSIEEQMTSISKSVAGLNLGANDPLIKSAIQCGIDKHKSMGSCDVREATVSSRYCTNPNPTRKRADCRIDCLSGCTVIEFKPNNDAAKKAGDRQVDAYAQALRKWHRTEGDQMFKGDFEKLRSCVKGDGESKQIALDERVETYNFCDCFPDLMAGVPRQEPTVDIPERER